MKITRSVKTATVGLLAHKSRSALTILGIVIGISAIILIASVGNAAESLILGQIESLGTNVIAVVPGKEPTGPTDPAAAESLFSDSLKQKELDALSNKSNLPNAAEIIPVVFSVESVAYENETFRPLVLGASEHVANLFDLTTEEGTFFTADDVQSISGVTVIGTEVKQELFGESDAVGKKIKKLMDEQRGKLVEGMVKNNIERETAEKIWDFIEPFARYGFNKAHATCYALVGYQTAYLKAHYPTELMAALMNSESDDIERIAFLIEECRQMGIDVLAPHINESLGSFTVIKDNVIRFGLNAIKNVGGNIVEAIVKERKKNGLFESISDLVERVQDKDLNKKSLESLAKCGALDCLSERGQILGNIQLILNFAKEVQKPKNTGQSSLFSLPAADGKKNGLMPSLKLLPAPESAKRDRLSWEKELLGLYISEHPVQEYEKVIESMATLPSKIIPQWVGRNLKVGGAITKIHKIITKTGKPMLFVTLEDRRSKVEVLVFPKTLERTATFWQEDKIAVVSGRLDDKEGNYKILCESAQELNQNHLRNFR